MRPNMHCSEISYLRMTAEYVKSNTYKYHIYRFLSVKWRAGLSPLVYFKLKSQNSLSKINYIVFNEKRNFI